ncbi:hypothetical protein HD806DRAFT_205305 [Xylariaceae sp. AK1471]|nr:hypothetical protein HD806DRAFT_205305 [Xylariaceae sp. AK1471]
MQFIQLLLLATSAAATPAAVSVPKKCPSNTITCGITLTEYPTASISGSVTCPSTVPTPSSNARLRIEGNDDEGTIFEGCIVAGPRELSTLSGGTHDCDGTNGGANPNPGTTPTNQLDAAAQLSSFSYDGTYSESFEDYFITSISASPQTSDDFWGILVNGQFTPTGGCQFEVGNGDETLFAFNAFNKVAFLKVTPEYAVAEVGSGTVTITVTDTISGNPQEGVSFGGQYTDVDGHATISVPDVSGCYKLKATNSDAVRSNAFYLTVVDSFTSSNR